MTPGKGLSCDITGLLGFICWKSPDSCNEPLQPGLGAARRLSRLPGWQEFGPGTFAQCARQPSSLTLPCRSRSRHSDLLVGRGLWKELQEAHAGGSRSCCSLRG